MATSTILIELIPLLMVPLLYRRGIQNWFDFCEQLRAEHKRHAMFVRSERGVRIDKRSWARELLRHGRLEVGTS